MEYEVAMRVPIGPRAAWAGRQCARSVEPFLDRLAYENLQLLASELVSNSVRHADTDAWSAVSMRIRLRGRSVRLEVSDPGSANRVGMREPSADAMSGWGLYLVDQISSQWGVHQEMGETTVWCEIPSSMDATSVLRDEDQPSRSGRS